MQYPLEVKFKAIALSNNVTVRDAVGNELMHVKQKAFKLKEKIEVYSDHTHSEQLFEFNADRIIDFSPLVTMRNMAGDVLGSVKRQGRKSLWRASYEITLAGEPFAQVSEMNPWAKVLDGLFGEIPFVGLFAGYLFHPKYQVNHVDGTVLAFIEKQPAFLEGKFSLEDGGSLSSQDEINQQRFAALLMVVTIYEKLRG